MLTTLIIYLLDKKYQNIRSTNYNKKIEKPKLFYCNFKIYGLLAVPSPSSTLISCINEIAGLI